MSRRDDLHHLSGVYALDAIDDEAQAERFARHLRRCQMCAGEVRGLREVATAMAFASADYEPPAAMRDNVLAAVARTRQLPPEVEPAKRRRSWFSWFAAGGPSVLVQRLATVAVAALAIVLGVRLLTYSDQLGHARAITAVLAAPDARVVAGPAAGGGRTTAVVSAARHELVITSIGLRALPGDKVYELWLIGVSSTRSAGLVAAGGGPVLAEGLAPGDKLGLTVEPAGGSRQPTTKPILLLPLS